MRVSKKICLALTMALVTLTISSSVRVAVAEVVPCKVLLDNTHADEWNWESITVKLKAYLEGIGYAVDYLNMGPINSTVLSDYSVLIEFYPMSVTPILPDEVTAIVSWVNAGHGLWLGGTYSDWHGSATELNKISSNWNIIFNSDEYSEDVTSMISHPVTTGVASFGTYQACSVSGGTPIAFYSDEKPVMTVATPGSGRVVAIGDSVSASGPFDDDHIDLSDNKILAMNTVEWLCTRAYVPVGENVEAFPDPRVGLVFGQVTDAGMATAAETTRYPPLPTPAGFIGPVWDIKVTAKFVGKAIVKLAYDPNGPVPTQLLQTDTVPSDVNVDGKVNWLDLWLIIKALCSTPGSPRWNPYCDLNGDNKINLKDLCIALQHFGQTSVWTNITTYVDTEHHVIIGETDHFSIFGTH